MKAFIVTAGIILLCALYANDASAQEKAPNADAAAQEAHDMAAAMPGPLHQALAKLAGDWTYTAKLTAEGPEPMQSTGTATMIMTLDGRFLHEQNSGSMMGMPVTGIRVLGYNNSTKKYEAVWTWTMSTGMLMMSGSSTDDGRTIVMDASYDDERGHNKLTITMRMIDDDHFTYELKGPEATMELNYTRKQ